MDLIDAHSHLTFDPLFADVDNVLQRSRDAGVTSWITVGTDADHNKKALDLAARFDNLYAAVGIHPHYAKSVTAQSITALKQIARNEKVVAIGETGLDFHYNFSVRIDQQRLFIEHLSIARELNLPVIIHCREAFDETIDVLDRYASDLRKIVFHCFSGSPGQAKIVLAKGFYISFTGVVTFKNADVARETARIVPSDRLMIETDCPYMSPEPMRKQKINEPALMIHTAKFIAELKKMDLDSFASAIAATTQNFFALPAV
jgi:TatD DNase family protein